MNEPLLLRGSFVKAQLLDQFATPFIAHVASGNNDDVNDPPHAQATTGYELEDSCSPFTNKHTVNAERSHKDGKD